MSIGVWRESRAGINSINGDKYQGLIKIIAFANDEPTFDMKDEFEVERFD